jgi:hypothetical protein
MTCEVCLRDWRTPWTAAAAARKLVSEEPRSPVFTVDLALAKTARIDAFKNAHIKMRRWYADLVLCESKPIDGTAFYCARAAIFQGRCHACTVAEGFAYARQRRVAMRVRKRRAESEELDTAPGKRPRTTAVSIGPVRPRETAY